jgi:hypothetical protein
MYHHGVGNTVYYNYHNITLYRICNHTKVFDRISACAT